MARDSTDFAPSPEPRQLGTAYGETQQSSVHEVPFKRHRRRRPDAVITVYYDSMAGLAARGVGQREPTWHPSPALAQPGFAAPPPRRW